MAERDSSTPNEDYWQHIWEFLQVTGLFSDFGWVLGTRLDLTHHDAFYSLYTIFSPLWFQHTNKTSPISEMKSNHFRANAIIASTILAGNLNQKNACYHKSYCTSFPVLSSWAMAVLICDMCFWWNGILEWSLSWELQSHLANCNESENDHCNTCGRVCL